MELHPSTMKHLEELLDRYPALIPIGGDIARSVQLLLTTYRADGKVLICGNGGSAADCEHIVGELMKGFVLKRGIPASDVEKLRASDVDGWESLADHLQRGIMAISLVGHPSLSTAVLNDTDPYIAFAQSVYAYGRPGDTLIGISTSGNARNVCGALGVARAFGLSTIGLTGARSSRMDALCDVTIKVPAVETFKIQEYHMPVYHAICLMLEQEVFGDMEGRF